MDRTVTKQKGGVPLPPPLKTPTLAASALLPRGAATKWLTVDAFGNSSMLNLSKAQLNKEMQALGVQVRDLRPLDPHLATTFPAALLSRESALILNLEYIKAIVARDRVYVTNLDHESVPPFVDELKRRLRAAAAGLASLPSGAELSKLAEQQLRQAEAAAAAAAAAARDPPVRGPGGAPRTPGAEGSVRRGGAPARELPFELRVMEVALDTICSHLGKVATDLEASALPAIDSLTKAVDTLNLERERRLKNRMVRLTARVQALREVLEALLDDDEDMADMNLTAKAAREAERATLAARREAYRGGSVELGQPMDVLLGSSPHAPGGAAGPSPSPFGRSAPGSPGSSLPSSKSTSVEEEENEAAIEEVEQLLEAYFMQIDNTYDRLQALAEYVDDAEDFINIELDSRRNEILKLDLVLTTVATSMATVTAATSLFAMNLKLSPDAEGQGAYWTFVTISVTSAVLALCVSAAVITYSRRKRLL